MARPRFSDRQAGSRQTFSERLTKVLRTGNGKRRKRRLSYALSYAPQGTICAPQGCSACCIPAGLSLTGQVNRFQTASPAFGQKSDLVERHVGGAGLLAILQADDNQRLDGVVALVDGEAAGDAGEVFGVLQSGLDRLAGQLVGTADGVAHELGKVVAQRVEGIGLSIVLRLEGLDEGGDGGVFAQRGVVVAEVNVVERIGTGQVDELGRVKAVGSQDGAVDALGTGGLDDGPTSS